MEVSSGIPNLDEISPSLRTSTVSIRSSLVPQSFSILSPIISIRINAFQLVPNRVHIRSPPGLSPDLQSMEQIRRIMRPTDVPDTGLLCDLLWSDPDKDVQGWGENDRGVSFTFGVDVVNKFLNRHELDLICRAHQVVEDGYEFFAKRQLVTLFSAPNYCGEFDNAGGMMSVDETLMCSFQVGFEVENFWTGSRCGSFSPY